MFVTLLQIWLSHSLDEVVKNLYFGCNYCFFTQRHNEKKVNFENDLSSCLFYNKNMVKIFFPHQSISTKYFVYN